MPTVEVGGELLSYRLPRPLAAQWLATMADPHGRIVSQSSAMVDFLAHVLGADEAGDILVDAMADRLDIDDVAGIIYDILGAGSARKYWQDTFLSRVAMVNWPMIRGQLVIRGIPDPMKQLPTLFALLDAVEAVYLEHADDKARAEWDRNYLPPPDIAAALLRREKLRQQRSAGTPGP